MSNIVIRSSGNLFFSHGTEFLDRRIVGCHIDNNTCWNVTEAKRGFTLTYNRVKNYLYFGNSNGIYEYNITTNTAKFIGAKNTIIWCMFVKKNKLFYIDYPSHHLYMVVNNSTSVKMGTKQYDYYFVSKHLVHYYTNRIGELYKIVKPAKFSNEAILLNHKLTVRQITEDIYGVVYICAKQGIYVDDGPFHRVTKIVEFGDLYSLSIITKLAHVNAVDELIFIYSNQDGIYKFNPSPYAKYCLNKSSIAAARMATPISKSNNWVSFSVKIDYD